jgi:hypothetical protein
MLIKHWLETPEIIFYRRYVDDTLIIFDTTKTNEHTTQNFMNSIHPLLLFTPTNEVENTITYLDLAIHQQNHTFQLGILHIPTQTDATIHFKSNQPIQNKLAAYRYHIKRMLTLPITGSTKNQEWNRICTMVKNNGFPLHIIQRIKNNLLSPTPNQAREHTQENLDSVHFS